MIETASLFMLMLIGLAVITHYQTKTQRQALALLRVQEGIRMQLDRTTEVVRDLLDEKERRDKDPYRTMAPGMVRFTLTQRDKDYVQEQIDRAMQSQREMLGRLIRELKDDPEALERLARDLESTLH